MSLEQPRVFFTGGNAQGKTSLLEAIAVGARLSSPRASRQVQMVQEGKTGCGVALETSNGLFKAVYGDRKYDLSLDGVPCKKKEYLFQSPRVVWMENRDMELVRASGERRRRYLDTIGSQLSAHYAVALRDYTKALRSRNALLKDQRAGGREFEAFTAQVIQHGKVLVDFRESIIESLLPHLVSSHQTISESKEQFSLTYQPSSRELETELPATFAQDQVMKQTLLGPHRDDFLIQVNDRPATDFASEGQQRTLAVALRLAQGKVLEGQGKVVYLVDDVFGELDDQRRNALMQAFPENAQTIMTTTHIHWGEVDAQVLKLQDYQVIV